MAEHVAFLSYQTTDRRIVRAAGQYLAKNGIEPILDEWSFRRGRSLQAEIETSIRRSTCFVLFWSQVAASSKYVQFEDEIAVARTIKEDTYRMQIVRLDETPLPERHSFILYHDWRRGKPGSELFQQHLEALKRSIVGLPGKDPPVTKSASAEPTASAQEPEIVIEVGGSEYRIRRKPDVFYIEDPPTRPIVKVVKGSELGGGA